MPTLVARAKKLHEINGNTLCVDEINREMENLEISFGILDDEANIPVVCGKASGHLVFEARITLEWKYR